MRGLITLEFEAKMALLSKRVNEIEVSSNLLPQLEKDNLLNKQLIDNFVEQLQSLEAHKTQMDAIAGNSNLVQQLAEENLSNKKWIENFGEKLLNLEEILQIAQMERENSEKQLLEKSTYEMLKMKHDL